MEDILQRMDPQKKERLINSAFEEFGKNKYDKASTNTIVKNAGISKGLLYHYFESKKSLYDYLIVFAICIIVDAIVDEVSWEEKDIFNRIKEVTLIKLRIFNVYPYMVDFSKNMYEGKTIDEIKTLVEAYVPDIYHRTFYHNIDFDFFKEDIDVQKAIKSIQWTLEKFVEEFLDAAIKTEQPLDFEKIIIELDQYLEMLRKAFYK
ncbi:MAG: TetR/AcrR family transcriptional regulator [Eubacteriaceae bacterium]